MNKSEKAHDLYDFMSQITSDMASEYARIQKRATEDPGTAGDQGEENWATLLKDWLPSSFHVVTKGRIISHRGKMSPQIDVLVLKNSYPRKLLDKKVYFAAGVAAAFECKVTLKANHIKEALENCVRVKELFNPRQGTPYSELHSPIVYGLLAHSHSWKGGNSRPLENVKAKLINEDKEFVDHPRKQLDILCVADLAMWSSAVFALPAPNSLGAATTVYVGHESTDENQGEHFTPVGVLITSLSRKLAWEHPDYQSMADYYRGTNISRAGGGTMRSWGSEIFSPSVQAGISVGQLRDGEQWNEWSVSFV